MNAPTSRRPVLGLLGALPWLLRAPGAAARPPDAPSPPPVYPTRPPPPARLHYTMRYGLLAGGGALDWRPDGPRYEMLLTGSVVGLRILEQVSRGGFDTAGLAPAEFSDQRLRREPRRARFDRQAGRVTYEPARAAVPLVPGMQDRLSWMIQLAAIAAARPPARGERVELCVTGARGNAARWTFGGAGSAEIATPQGSLATLKLASRPREADDTAVEVWLDPARHFLPVRARLTSRPEGDTLELSIEALQLG